MSISTDAFANARLRDNLVAWIHQPYATLAFQILVLLAVVAAPFVAIKFADYNMDRLPQYNSEWQVNNAQVFKSDIANPNQLPQDGWLDVTLPHRFGDPNSAPLSVWYRLTVAIEKPINDLWCVYLSKTNANYAVYVNGHLVGESDSMLRRPVPMYDRPLKFAFPGALLHAGLNHIYVRTQRDRSWTSLQTVNIGPDKILGPLFDADYLWQVTLRQITVICMLMMSLIMAALFRLRARDAAFSWFALALLFWSARIIVKLIPQSPVDAPHLWANFQAIGAGGFAICATLFVHRFLNIHRPLLERAVAAWGLLGALVLILDPILLGYRLPKFYEYVWFPPLLWVAVYATWQMIRAAIYTPSIETRLFAIISWWNLVLGMRDSLMGIGLLKNRPQYLTFAAAHVLIVFGFVLLRRYVLAAEDIERTRDELQLRVAQKSQELQHNLIRIKDMERESALHAERERIMRDMHDGVGGQLVQALSIAANRPELKPIEQPLRHCLEELRLIIDSIEPVNGDLASVLGMLRMRMSRRLREAGIATRWQVRDIPTLADFGPQRVLQISRIVQEAIANTLKHARATLITVHAHIDSALRSGKSTNDLSEIVIVEIIDNGAGFVAAQTNGRGLKNMQCRATELGGRLIVSSSDRGTNVRLEIPTGRRPSKEPVFAQSPKEVYSANGEVVQNNIREKRIGIV